MDWWPLTEGSGTTAYDQSGNGNNGSWNGAQTGSSGYYSGGKIGPYAGIFDGSTDYVNVGTSSVLIPANITLSAWVRPSRIDTWDGIITNFSSWDAGFGLQVGTAQNIAATIAGHTYLETSWVPQAGNWYHIVATHNSADNSNYLYVNGSFQASTTQVLTYEASPKTYIGAFYTSPNLIFPGLITDVRIYNRVLSAGEAAALYNAEK